MRVTFCGHKEVHNEDDVRQWLCGVCTELIAQGASEFYCGGYGHFDHMCATTLRNLKQQYPGIRIVLVLPYLNSTMLTVGYDETVYPPLESVPKRYAISRRNEWMVRKSDTVVAYVIRGFGGAAKTLEYAQRKKKRIITFNPDFSYGSGPNDSWRSL